MSGSKADAERYFKEGAEALGRGDLTEAMVKLQSALNLDPGNEEYQQALREARARADELGQAALEPGERPEGLSPERRRTGLIALGLSLACLAGAWTWTLWPAPPPVNLASDYSAVAEFTRLQKQPDGVWSGELAEDWAQLDPAAQQARCDAIAEGLTGGEAGTVVLQSADEVLLICGEGQ
jgi:hypothetical protein